MREDFPLAFWRDAPPQHFDTETGDYQELRAEPTECVASKGVKLLPDNSLQATDPQGQVILYQAICILSMWNIPSGKLESKGRFVFHASETSVCHKSCIDPAKVDSGLHICSIASTTGKASLSMDARLY